MKFHWLLIIILLNFSLNEETCDQNDPSKQCGEKYEIEYPIENEDTFLNLPFLTKDSPELNSSDYLDFRINKKVIEYLKNETIIPYPRFRFVGRQTGNFLHFMYQAYIKKLPVFFTVDQMLYPFIVKTKDIIHFFLEEAYALKLELIFTKMIRHANEENYDKEIIKYISIGLMLLNKHNPEKTKISGQKTWQDDETEKAT